jgi:hypothetical protein
MTVIRHTIDSAFKAAMAGLRADGLPVTGREVPVLAAYRVFERRAKRVEHDPRFSADAPRFARTLILEALTLSPAA